MNEQLKNILSGANQGQGLPVDPGMTQGLVGHLIGKMDELGEAIEMIAGNSQFNSMMNEYSRLFVQCICRILVEGDIISEEDLAKRIDKEVKEPIENLEKMRTAKIEEALEEQAKQAAENIAKEDSDLNEDEDEDTGEPILASERAKLND